MAKQISKINELKLLSGLNGLDLRLLVYTCELINSDGDYQKRHQKVIAIKNLTTEQKAGLLTLWKTLKDNIELTEGLVPLADPVVDSDDGGFL